MKISGQARFALGLLLAVNLLNYLDRQVLYSLLPLIQSDLRISDTQSGQLASAFMVVYMLAAPPIGYWADRAGRRLWITIGVVLWSVATAASGLAGNFSQLFGARAAVGIGESCYGAISPSFVAEHFEPKLRARVLAVFSMAIPVGSALGYIAGGALGQRFGWRAAFCLVGLPGLILGVLTSRLSEPRSSPQAAAPVSAWRSYAALFEIPSFTLVTLCGAAMTFCLGGFAVWMPSFFHRAWNLSVGQAGTLVGAVTVTAGFTGSMAGGWIADRLLPRTNKAYLWVSGAGLLLGLPLALATIMAPNLHSAVGALLLAEFFLFLNMGPLNAAIIAVSDVAQRSMAFAANILVIHALGDAISPTIIGALSDRCGLAKALMLSTAGLAAAGGFCFWAMAYYDRDARYAHV